MTVYILISMLGRCISVKRNVVTSGENINFEVKIVKILNIKY